MSEEQKPPEAEVVWYGERGVVNALVGELRNRGRDGVQEFLKAVYWGEDGEIPEWIDEIDETDGVTYIVEIGLAEFGDPDLMIVCRCKRKTEPRLVFVEAKVIGYFVSAMSNWKGMAAEGFNSSINGQLSLKYRFARALKEWDGASDITEPQDIYQAYSEDLGGLSDTASARRHLQKPSVLHILKDMNVARLPLECAHFVALTWDCEAFWKPEKGEKEKKEKKCTLETRPLFLDQEGTDLWDKILPRVGWIGYEELEDFECFDNEQKENVQKALKTMGLHERPKDDHEIATGQRIRTCNIKENFQKETIELLERIERAAKGVFHDRAVTRSAGSTSITLRGRVVVKLIPHTGDSNNPAGANERIWLGVLASLTHTDWDENSFPDIRKVGTGTSARDFRMRPLRNDDKAVDDARRIFEQVKRLPR